MFAHHFHTRRRREPYPSKSFRLRVLDYTVYTAGILGPLATVPQIFSIYTTHNVVGVSFWSWALYALFDIPWVTYAFVHKEPPLIVCYTIWLVLNTLVAIGVLLYTTTPLIGVF